MAEHTSNINLSKPTYSEDADIAVINSNMDIIDGKMGAVGNTSVQAQLNTASTNITNLGKELCAVVAGKQSTTGAATGEYVIVRGSTISGISDGAYIAAKTIPANTNLDSSYFSSTGMTKGIANALNSKITSLDSKVKVIQVSSGDFDTMTTANGYRALYCGQAIGNFTHGPSGIPTNYPFTLEVLQLGNNSNNQNYSKQILHIYGTSPVTFERQEYYSGGAYHWGDWQELALKSYVDKIDARSLSVQNSEEVAAGAVKSFSIGTAYTGYTPIGIVSITGSGTSGLVLQEYYLYGGNAVIYFKNTTNNPITPSLITVTILYKMS